MSTLQEHRSRLLHIYSSASIQRKRGSKGLRGEVNCKNAGIGEEEMTHEQADLPPSVVFLGQFSQLH